MKNLLYFGRETDRDCLYALMKESSPRYFEFRFYNVIKVKSLGQLV